MMTYIQLLHRTSCARVPSKKSRSGGCRTRLICPFWDLEAAVTALQNTRAEGHVHRCLCRKGNISLAIVGAEIGADRAQRHGCNANSSEGAAATLRTVN